MPLNTLCSQDHTGSSAYFHVFVHHACRVWALSYPPTYLSVQGVAEGTKTVAYLLDAQTINIKVL